MDDGGVAASLSLLQSSGRLRADDQRKSEDRKNSNRGGRLRIGEGEENMLGFFFCVFGSSPQNYINDPPYPLSFQPIFIGKSLFKPPNWSLNFLFFVNFDFSCFFLYFLKMSKININSMRKIMILK